MQIQANINLKCISDNHVFFPGPSKKWSNLCFSLTWLGDLDKRINEAKDSEWSWDILFGALITLYLFF